MQINHSRRSGRSHRRVCALRKGAGDQRHRRARRAVPHRRRDRSLRHRREPVRHRAKSATSATTGRRSISRATVARTNITTYGRDFATTAITFYREPHAGQDRPADAVLGPLSRRLARRRRPCQPDPDAGGRTAMTADTTSYFAGQGRSAGSTDNLAVDVGRARRHRAQDHPRRRAAADARRRDRQRADSNPAHRSTKANWRGVSASRARRCARRCASSSPAAWSTPARIAAPWSRIRTPSG